MSAATPEPLRFEQLETALETGDAVAIAFALRNGHVVVPLIPTEGPPQVRVFLRDDAEQYMLLLFSSAEAYARMAPSETDQRSIAYDGAALRGFLEENLGVLESVWFDVAGPNPVQAHPQDVLDTLRLEG